MKYLIKTARIGLRKMTLDDAAHLLMIHTDPGYHDYIPDRGITDLAKSRDFIAEKIIPAYEKFGYGYYLASKLSDNAVIGMAGLMKRDAIGDVDIGYGLRPQYQRQGFAIEMATALKQYGHDVLAIDRIVAIANPENSASVALLAKLGLTYAGMTELAPNDVVGLYTPDAKSV